MKTSKQFPEMKMRYTFFLVAFILLQAGLVFAQKNVTINGYIQDKQTTERLPGASVYIEGINKGTASNRFGFYSVTLPAGVCSVRYSFVGYEPVTMLLKIEQDTSINITLSTDLKIEEVTVKERTRNPNLIESTETGTNIVTVDHIKKTPVIAGESDVFKTLQFLPGIKQSQEGTSGINVRGGSPDQNLILLDGVPIYNVSHLFGFLSVFNSDALSQVKLYKGDMPARYGGKLSSVLDVTLKEGNNQTPLGTFSISPVSGKFTLEGPIKSDTASYIISGRRSFLDIPIRIGLMLSQPLQAGYYFHDYTAKTNWKVNSGNRIYFSSYLGRDRYFIKYKEEGSSSDYSYDWGNVTSVLRWNCEVNSKLFFNTTGYYSRFYNNQQIKYKIQRTSVLNMDSKLNDFSLGTDFDYYPSLEHNIKFGYRFSAQSFSPKITEQKGMENDTVMGKDLQQRAASYSLCAEDDIFLSPRIRILAGLRYDGYMTGGKNYHYFQPRISGRFLVSTTFSVKASYSRVSQFLHLLSNTSIGLPTDLWVPSTEKTKPQEAWQSALGLYFLPDPAWEFSVEGYYKKMNRVIQMNEGTSFFDSRQKSWEENIIVGQGLAYGSEFLAKRVAGNLTGWLGYTISWSNRQFEELNNGKPFPYRYDKRHDVALLGEYKIFDNGIDSKTFSFGFTYNTGYAVSIPDIKHHGLNILTEKGDHGYLGMFDYFKTRLTYAHPNNYRMPAFHHLDVGYHLSRKLSHFRHRTWSFTVYNIYNRLNPWYFYPKDDKLRQVSLFPVIPSVSYTYRW